MKQFTTRSEPIRFRIDDDDFEAASEIPAATLFELAGVKDEIRAAENRTQQFDALLSIFQKLLTDESYKMLHDRVSSREKPIPNKTLMEVMDWLLGEGYGMRPTQPPSSSPGQSAEPSGDTSTAGVSPALSSPSPSPGPAS